MSKRQEIVILRLEVARWQTLYEAAVTANGNLQAQLVALAGREPAAADIVREVMAGFKAVMNPDLPPADEPVDLYAAAPAPGVIPRPDPAWDLSDVDLVPDGFNELLEREGLEDAV